MHEKTRSFANSQLCAKPHALGKLIEAISISIVLAEEMILGSRPSYLTIGASSDKFFTPDLKATPVHSSN
jgi:hypothetical protein